MNELHSSIVTDLIQSGVLADMKGDDSKISFLRDLGQIYYEKESVECYIIPYLNIGSAVAESISPWVIEDAVNNVTVRKAIPLAASLVPVFSPIGGVVGPIKSHLGAIQNIPIGGQISPFLIPFLDVSTSHRHGLIGSEIDSIVALVDGRIKPVAGHIRPVISPVTPQYLRAIDSIAKLTPLALEMTTILFPGTTSTLRRSAPIIQKASKLIGTGTFVFGIFNRVRRWWKS